MRFEYGLFSGTTRWFLTKGPGSQIGASGKMTKKMTKYGQSGHNLKVANIHVLLIKFNGREKSERMESTW
jgi:hypothetical protein